MLTVALLGGLLLFAAIIALVVVVIVVYVRRERRRVAALAAAAYRQGWWFEPQNNAYRERFLGTPFDKARGNVNNIVSGTHRGRPMFACEFVYTTSTGKSQQTHYYAVVAVGTPAQRPMLQITREGALHGLLAAFGVHDLQLESAAFNDAYRINTDNDRFAYDVLHPRMMGFMLADQRAWRWPLRFERADLLSWEYGKLDWNKLMWMLDYVSDVADRVPEFVWR